MGNEVIFATQIGTILGFVVLLFVLYRVLVNQKDATIELLKEKNSYLITQLANAAAHEPDALVQAISARVKVLNEELERLSKDKSANEDRIQVKENELKKANLDMRTLREQMERAEELMTEFFCPNCKAPMLQREFGVESIEYDGKDIDIDREFVLFECGLSYLDGNKDTECGSL